MTTKGPGVDLVSPRRLLFASTAFVTLATCHVVMAQEQTKASIAEGLFRAARLDMRAGRYASACPKFDESYRLDPASGTLLNRAVCHERVGHIATAWAQYIQFVETAPSDDERIRFARQCIRDLEPHLPRLRITTSGAPPAATLYLDGVQLNLASTGVDMPVDAGEHTAALVWPDGKRVKRAVTAAPDHVVTIDFDPSRDDAAFRPGPMQTPVPLRTERQSAPEASRDHSTKASQPARSTANRALIRAGYTAAGTGVLGFVAAGILSVLASSKESTVAAHCSNKQCDDTGLRTASEGRALLRAADVGLVLGTLGLGTAAAMLFEAWRAKPTVVADGDGAVFAMTGRW